MHIQPNFQTKFYNFVKLTRKGVIISIKNSALSAFMTLMVVPKMNMTHFWVVDLLMYVRDPQLNFCMNNMSNNYSCMNHYFALQKRQKYLHATNLRIFVSGNNLLFDNILK